MKNWISKTTKSLTLLTGIVIAPGASFEAEDQDIPQAFRDMVICVTPPKKEEEKKQDQDPPVLTRTRAPREVKTEEEILQDLLAEEAQADAKQDEDTKESTKKPYVKKHNGSGWYLIVDNEGVQVGGLMRQNKANEELERLNG